MGGFFHWGPMIATTIIVLLFTGTLFCAPHVLLHTTTGVLIFAVWVADVAVLTFSYAKAIRTRGGAVETGWRPKLKENESKLQYCESCKGFKPPRSHHCHTCGVCVKKMDHHCPWINSCVGNDNHAAFVTFVTVTPIGCLICFYVFVSFLLQHYQVMRQSARQYYRYPGLRDYDLKIFAGIMFMTGLSLAVSIAVGFLGYIQWRGILRNRTDIESWILEKAESRKRDTPFVYPYSFGWRKNIEIVFKNSLFGDGITWPVVEGCTEYTLTEEQLEQKKLKRKRYRIGVTVDESGSCGLGHGLCVIFNTPCFDTRISVKKDEIIQYWSVKKYWVYGEKMKKSEAKDKFVSVKPRQRGWFPKACLRDVGPASGEDPKKD